MSDVLLTALVRTLDLCVIEAEGPAGTDAVLRLQTPAPGWLSAVFEAVPQEDGTLAGALPFLDHFLVQAAAAWHEGHPASASSGPFVAPTPGEDALIRAVAMTQDGRRLLILQRLSGDADLRPSLQRAREQTLEHEQLVKRIGGLHVPAAAFDRDVKALLAAALSPDQQRLVERLSQSSAEVQAVLATLPAPPRQRRQVRTK